MDTTRYQHRLCHQAGAKMTVLDAVARAADIEIDLIIAPLGSQVSTRRQVSGVIATQL